MNTQVRDIAGGVLLIALGVATFAYSWGRYDPGTLFRVGPGAFPLALAVLITVLGAAVVVGAMVVEVRGVQVRLRPIVFVSLALAAFALMIERFGMVPSVVAVVVLSSLAESRPRPLEVLVLAAVLALVSVLVFRHGLGMTIPVFRW